MNNPTALPIHLQPLPGSSTDRGAFHELLNHAATLLAAGNRAAGLEILEEMATDDDMPLWFHANVQVLFAQAKPTSTEQFAHIRRAGAALDRLSRSSSSPSSFAASSSAAAAASSSTSSAMTNVVKRQMVLRFVRLTRSRLDELRREIDDREERGHAAAYAAAAGDAANADAPAAANAEKEVEKSGCGCCQIVGVGHVGAGVKTGDGDDEEEAEENVKAEAGGTDDGAAAAVAADADGSIAADVTAPADGTVVADADQKVADRVDGDSLANGNPATEDSKGGEEAKGA